MRSELDIYAEMTLKLGGVWYRLDEKNGYSVYKTQDKYTEHNYTGYTTPTEKECLQARILLKQ